MGEIESSFYNKVNEKAYRSTDLSGKNISFGLTFSPDHTDTKYESYQKHIKSNPIQLFVGGASVTTTIIGKNVFVSVYNESSRNSFFLHGKGELAWAGENEKRQSQTSGGRPLSTITQTIEGVFNLDESRINNK